MPEQRRSDYWWGSKIERDAYTSYQQEKQQIGVISHNEILFCVNKEQTTDTCTTIDQSQNHVEKKKPNGKDPMLFDFINMKLK